MTTMSTVSHATGLSFFGGFRLYLHSFSIGGVAYSCMACSQRGICPLDDRGGLLQIGEQTNMQFE